MHHEVRSLATLSFKDVKLTVQKFSLAIKSAMIDPKHRHSRRARSNPTRTQRMERRRLDTTEKMQQHSTQAKWSAPQHSSPGRLCLTSVFRPIKTLMPVNLTLACHRTHQSFPRSRFQPTQAKRRARSPRHRTQRCTDTNAISRRRTRTSREQSHHLK